MAIIPTQTKKDLYTHIAIIISLFLVLFFVLVLIVFFILVLFISKIYFYCILIYLDIINLKL